VLNAKEAELWALRQRIPIGCRIVAYGKSELKPEGSCPASLPANTVCVPTPNMGREFATYLVHVTRHLEELPDWLIMLPGELWRHDREYHLYRMLEATVLSGTHRTSSSFWCVRRMSACEGFWDKPRQNVSQYHRFGMPSYNMLDVQQMQYERSGGLIRHSLGTVRGMALQLRGGMEASWAEVNGSAARLNESLVNEERRALCRRTCATGVCHYGMLATTRENLRAQPRALYEALLEGEFRQPNPEAGFVLEVIAELIFGRLVADAAPPPTRGCSATCELHCPNELSRDGLEGCVDDPSGADPSGPREAWLWTRDVRPTQHHSIDWVRAELARLE